MEENKTNLKDFIEDNYKLLSSIGIFGALSAFFTTLQYQYKDYLTFITFSIFILLCWELWTNFPKSEKAKATMHIFEYFFLLFVIMVGGYIFYTFKEIIIKGSFVVFMVIYSLILIKIINKFKLFLIIRKIAGRNKNLNSLIRSVVGIIILISLVYLSVISTKYLMKYFGLNFS